MAKRVKDVGDARNEEERAFLSFRFIAAKEVRMLRGLLDVGGDVGKAIETTQAHVSSTLPPEVAERVKRVAATAIRFMATNPKAGGWTGNDYEWNWDDDW